MPPKSAIWHYFVKSGAVAKCKICQLDVKTAGNTTNLHFHMNRSHPDIQTSFEKKSTVSFKRKQMVTYYITYSSVFILINMFYINKCLNYI